MPADFVCRESLSPEYHWKKKTNTSLGPNICVVKSQLEECEVLLFVVA